MKSIFIRFKDWLTGLSFTTGLIVAGVCVVCYAASFAQMLLPLSVGVKGVLWVVLYGMAKTCQYTALLILGKNGVQRIRRYVGSRKQ